MDFRTLRREMMVLSNTIDEHQSRERSRELSVSKTKVQEAQMWCGKYLDITSPDRNPYKENDGKRETVDDIKPTFDSTEATFHSDNRIVVVDRMREALKISIDEMEVFIAEQPFISAKCDLAKSVIMQCMMEARMWLGMELGRIKREGE